MTDSTRLEIVDAHHHVWDLERNYHPWLRDEPMIPFRYGDYSAIRRTYMPEHYRRDAAPFHLAASVYVETEWNDRDPIGETQWIHEISSKEALPNAVVAQAWLDRDDVADVLAAQVAFPLVRSVRHKPRAARTRAMARRGEAGSMDCPKWRSGFALLERHGLHFDLQTPWWHFDAAVDLARDFPRTLIIVNHTGLPSDRSTEGIAGWRAAMAALATRENVRLKISGLGLPGRAWTIADNGPIIQDAIRIFGPARCMFASNFPVDSLVARYEEIFSGFDSITADMPDIDRRRLFAETAREVYRPEVLATEPSRD
jgi:predicted TIM-barrel fold metal-dependent hydrolase